MNNTASILHVSDIDFLYTVYCNLYNHSTNSIDEISSLESGDLYSEQGALHSKDGEEQHSDLQQQ